MPVSPTYPGVYVQEVPSGVRTIVGVSTSTTLFVGRTKMGPMNRAIRLTTYTDYARTFGEDNLVSDMTRQVRMFFLNGGSDCYVIRIAQGAAAAKVDLRPEGAAANPTLRLTAKNPGLVGNDLRAAVTYGGPYPEATFTLEVFRWALDSQGQRVKTDREVWANLTMDPSSPTFAPTVLTQKSGLVNATELDVPAPGATFPGWSLSGRPVLINPSSVANFQAAWGALLGSTQTKNKFRISVDGSPYVEVDLKPIVVPTGADVAAAATALAGAISDRIHAALVATLGSYPNPPCQVELVDTAMSPGPAATRQLKLTSLANKNIRVLPAISLAEDVSQVLMLGEAQGGIEAGAYAARRPAPTGVSYRASSLAALTGFGSLLQDAVTSIRLNQVNAAGTILDKDLAVNLDNPPPPIDRMWQDAAGGPNGLREKLGYIRDAVNAYQAANPSTFFWRAELAGHRLTLTPTGLGDAVVPAFQSATTNLAAHFTVNARYYQLGIGGGGAFQTAGQAGSDGDAPHAADYRAAYEKAESEVDLFNILVLPRDHNPAPGADLEQLWGEASAYCQKRRAFLVMEPPAAWTSSQTATDTVGALRVGLVKDYSAVYYPRLQVVEGGNLVTIGASGAIAGLYARQDANRGVWKAPAGSEADLRGIVGVDQKLSDAHNGQLNPLGINAIRLFPEGVVSWGARTNAGADALASEYKYIPIRRLALFLEESLYRGLKWVVFEPNDEALWAQIRMNAGAFMHGLFRQGAFQGTKPQDAYFVKCDAETTTQADRNLGIVNIWIGFAPLKPAEFVILYLQQIAGQLPT